MSKNELEEVRREIDAVDLLLLKSVANRQKLARKAGELKREAGLKIHDPKREKEVLELRREWAEQLELDPDSVEELFHLLIDESRKLQEKDKKGDE